MYSVIKAALTGLRVAGGHQTRSPAIWRVRPSPLDPRKALVSGPGAPPRAAAGRTGIRPRKHEGDGSTPAGRFRPVALLFRADRVGFRHATLPHRAIGSTDGWCDDPASFSYNRHVRSPAAASHERLRRDDELYNVLVVLDHNQRPRIRGAGSAVFLHVARPGLTPTAGCLAFPLADWRRRRLYTTLPSTVLIDRDPRPVRRPGRRAKGDARRRALFSTDSRQRGLW